MDELELLRAENAALLADAATLNELLATAGAELRLANEKLAVLEQNAVSLRGAYLAVHREHKVLLDELVVLKSAPPVVVR